MVFKQGGPYKKGDLEYSAKTVNTVEVAEYLASGWVLNVDDLITTGEPEIEPDTTFTEETVLSEREQIIEDLEAAGIEYDGRWGVERLKEALANG